MIVRRLFRIGRLPDELRAQVEAEGLRFLEEYVPVTRRFSGRIPGKRAHGDVASYTGALALTDERVLATLSTVPKLAARSVDQRWDAEQSGNTTVELSETGLLIGVDLPAVDPRFSGTLSLHYKADLDPGLLASLPLRRLAFDVPPGYVFRAVGVPYDP
ncbi:hypothetical protein C731_0494 [Mycolicibacterium hassiacum DSM 44199]|uniref:Uncharacterized protein n=1 Tax=Mycolicibacterium hassiacum (strain DSM 44199 / CIP 105218 / JCM 12690 / 3849) TaxID=1122247 RepID=K5BCX1_MYCHD|nr:hypothetical protein C731_0494 [Mycolicibacterium hassiacum DSM 44199]